MLGIGVWLLLLLYSVSRHHPGTLLQTRRCAEPMEKRRAVNQFFIQTPYIQFLQILPLYPLKINKLRYLALQMLQVLSDLEILEMKHTQQDAAFLQIQFVI